MSTTLETDRWRTPESVLERVRQLGPIGLDPFTETDNPVGAELIYTLAEDAYEQHWAVDVRELAAAPLIYVNPPYSRGHLPRVEKKIAEELEVDEDDLEIVLLVPCDPSTLWYERMRETASSKCDWAGRIRFNIPAGLVGQPRLDRLGNPRGSVWSADATAGARGPSTLWYYGPRPHLFCHLFQDHGHVRVLR